MTKIYTEINVITIKKENKVGLVGEIVIGAFNGLIYYPDNNLAHSGQRSSNFWFECKL